jgi:glycine/D-amino acid oxidase-like deaminating enzyme
MTMPDDIAIIGAGLSGLTLAQSLLDKGLNGAQITLVDAHDDTRASDVPGTLMHPFAGRSMQPKPGQLTSARTSVDALRRLRDEAGDGAVLELAMARPVSGGDLVGGKKQAMASGLRDTWQASKDDYPDWVDSRLVGGTQLVEVDPRLARYDEALVYSPAFSVDTHKVRRHLRAKFRDAGVHLVDETTVASLERAGGRWHLATDGDYVRATRVVLAVGWGLATWFPGLPIRGKGGEVLIVQPPRGVELGCIINASGHVAPRGDGTWSAGSTYWSASRFGARTDEQALTEILERCERLVPELADSEPLEIGRGIRASYRGDNRPLVGAVPTVDDLYVFGAFGSKGLLRIPHLAAQLADHLTAGQLGGANIGQRASTARVNVEKWQPAPNLF